MALQVLEAMVHCIWTLYFIYSQFSLIALVYGRQKQLRSNSIYCLNKKYPDWVKALCPILGNVRRTLSKWSTLWWGPPNWSGDREPSNHLEKQRMFNFDKWSHQVGQNKWLSLCERHWSSLEALLFITKISKHTKNRGNNIRNLHKTITELYHHQYSAILSSILLLYPPQLFGSQSQHMISSLNTSVCTL